MLRYFGVQVTAATVEFVPDGVPADTDDIFAKPVPVFDTPPAADDPPPAAGLL